MERDGSLGSRLADVKLIGQRAVWCKKRDQEVDGARVSIGEQFNALKSQSSPIEASGSNTPPFPVLLCIISPTISQSPSVLPLLYLDPLYPALFIHQCSSFELIRQI